MAICQKCDNVKLEWVKDNNSWKLYNHETGVWHDKECNPITTKTVSFKQLKKQAMACRHGILLDRYCDLCNPN